MKASGPDEIQQTASFGSERIVTFVLHTYLIVWGIRSDNLIPIERLSNEYIDTKKERKKKRGRGDSGGRMGLDAGFIRTKCCTFHSDSTSHSRLDAIIDKSCFRWVSNEAVSRHKTKQKCRKGITVQLQWGATYTIVWQRRWPVDMLEFHSFCGRPSRTTI